MKCTCEYLRFTYGQISVCIHVCLRMHTCRYSYRWHPCSIQILPAFPGGWSDEVANSAIGLLEGCSLESILFGACWPMFLVLVWFPLRYEFIFNHQHSFTWTICVLFALVLALYRILSTGTTISILLDRAVALHVIQSLRSQAIPRPMVRLCFGG